MRTVNKKRFYDRIYRKPYYSTQIGFSTVRFTDSIGKLLGIVIFHENGNTYIIK